MAAASPALSNNSNDTSSIAAVSIGGNSSKTQRGLNKPKCIKCGNVARSRCPYQSCKNCCAKAQNPCHIHVLKGASSLPDKVPSSGSPSVEQQATEISSSGNSFRTASLRQLSNNFAQFNNLQSPLRSRKPLTKKEALVINEWRFLKLKEYRDRNIEAENDAFDRYMQNVSLLEEVFAASSTIEESKKHVSPVANPSTNLEQKAESISNPDPNSEQNHEPIANINPNSERNDESTQNPDLNSKENHEMILQLKLKLLSDPERTEISRKRVRYIVDQGLKRLQKLDTPEMVYDLCDEGELIKKPKKAEYSRVERLVALRELTDKLSKARSEEDLKTCLDIKTQLFDTREKGIEEVSGDFEALEQKEATKEDSYKQPTPPKWFTTVTVDQDAVNRMDAYFSSLEEIEDI